MARVKRSMALLTAGLLLAMAVSLIGCGSKGPKTKASKTTAGADEGGAEPAGPPPEREDLRSPVRQIKGSK